MVEGIGIGWAHKIWLKEFSLCPSCCCVPAEVGEGVKNRCYWRCGREGVWRYVDLKTKIAVFVWIVCWAINFTVFFFLAFYFGKISRGFCSGYCDYPNRHNTFPNMYSNGCGACHFECVRARQHTHTHTHEVERWCVSFNTHFIVHHAFKNRIQ